MEPEDYRELLRRHDDPVYWEWPGGWNRETAKARLVAEEKFLAFAEDIQQALGMRCVVESGVHIQDASFHGQISLPPECLLTEVYIKLRVSNFGGFATVLDGEQAVKPDCLEKIKAVIRQNGYVYIPPVFLSELYTGVNAGVTGIDNWATRYFDWV